MLWGNSPQVFSERADLIFIRPLSSPLLPNTANTDELRLIKVRRGLSEHPAELSQTCQSGIFSIFENESAFLKVFPLNNFKSRRNTGRQMVRKLNIFIFIFISVFFGTVPAFAEGMITGEVIQVQGIKETLTEGVYIGSIAIALMEDRKFEIKPIDKVIGHMIKSETSINYMGFIVHTVTVLGYDGMKVGVMVYSEDDGIIDYHTISLKK
jgi:hypothetical protein